MIDVINKISINDTKYNSNTLDYMKNANMTVPPEDVYFSLNMINNNIGKVAHWDEAYKFSTESIFNPNSFGGHNFWLSNPNWKNVLYKNNVIQYKPEFDISTAKIEHRGGWKSIINYMINIDYFVRGLRSMDL